MRVWNQHYCGYGNGLFEHFGESGHGVTEKMEWGREGVSAGSHKMGNHESQKRAL